MFKFVGLAQNSMIMYEMVLTTFRRSSAVLIVFLFFSLLAMVFFSCLIYAFEMGTFTVTEEFPDGAYLRPSINQAFQEVSPFTSISASMYYAIVTGMHICTCSNKYTQTHTNTHIYRVKHLQANQIPVYKIIISLFSRQPGYYSIVHNGHTLKYYCPLPAACCLYLFLVLSDVLPFYSHTIYYCMYVIVIDDDY
jgi:hypothetical protein